MVFSLAAAIAGLILLWFYYNLPYKLNMLERNGAE